MDLKKELLLYLHDRKDSMEYYNVNHILKESGVSIHMIRDLLQMLVAEKIIKINGELYKGLGGHRDRIEQTLDVVAINARLDIMTGEKYVKDNYLKSMENTTIIHGDNLGNVLQGDNKSSHQSSSSTKNIATAKTGAVKKAIISILVGLVVAIIAMILSHIWK